MDFKTEIDACGVIDIQNGFLTSRQLFKRIFDKACWALGPWIEIWKRK